MRRFVLFAAVFAVGFAASCGGGGSGPTPTPTSDGTKALTAAGYQESTNASFTGMGAALENFAPKAMVVKVAKALYEGSGTATYNCGGGGTVETSATGTGDCDILAGGYTCTNMIFDVTLTFHDCAANVIVNSTEYAEVLNGTGTSRFTGSVSGPTDSLPTSGTLVGTFAETLTATGTAEGTVNLSGLELTGTLSGASEPTIECSGTTEVTIGSTTQVCAISSDCSTCTE